MLLGWVDSPTTCSISIDQHPFQQIQPMYAQVTAPLTMWIHLGFATPSLLVFWRSITAVMKYPTERKENKFSAKEMKDRLGAVVISWHKSEHESMVSRFLTANLWSFDVFCTCFCYLELFGLSMVTSHLSRNRQNWETYGKIMSTSMNTYSNNLLVI